MGDKGVEGITDVDVFQWRDTEPRFSPADAIVQVVAATKFLVGHQWRVVLNTAGIDSWIGHRRLEFLRFLQDGSHAHEVRAVETVIFQAKHRAWQVEFRNQLSFYNEVIILITSRHGDNRS